MEPYVGVGVLDGQLVFRCLECGALVTDGGKASHNQFHAALIGLEAYSRGNSPSFDGGRRGD